MDFQHDQSPLFLTPPSSWDVNINEAQLANAKVEVWSEKPFGKNISNLLTRRDVRNAYAPIVKFFFDKMSINLNMFSSIMLNRVVSNTNSGFIITEKLQWCLTFLMKICQNFLKPNFLTYFQTHSLVFDGLSVAPPQHFAFYSSKLQDCPKQRYNNRR